jgi:hypothetical protein
LTSEKAEVHAAEAEQRLPEAPDASPGSAESVDLAVNTVQVNHADKTEEFSEHSKRFRLLSAETGK